MIDSALRLEMHDLIERRIGHGHRIRCQHL
jgi:hypothetical protein